MRAVVLIFILFQILIFKSGKVHIYTHSDTLFSQKYKESRKTLKTHLFSERKNVPVSSDHSVFVEDIEDYSRTIREYGLSSIVIIAMVFAIMFFNFRRLLKEHLPFCNYLASASQNKYILQRVLRI